MKGRGSVRTEAVAIVSNTAEKPRDQIKEGLQGHCCLSQKPGGDKRLRSEQVIAKLEFIMDFPLHKRKNRMENGVESKRKCFCYFLIY